MKAARRQFPKGVATRPIRFPVVLSITATTAGVIPVFLVGALTVQIRRQLHFGASGLGVAVAAFFVGATAGSLLAGHISHRIGLSRAMRIGALGSALCLAAMAVLSHSLLDLTVFLVIAGFTDGVIQPAANGFVAGRVPSGRQGLAFGIKQSAVPLSTLLGGLAVPAIALTVGWRWAFAAAAFGALMATVALPSRRRMHLPPPGRPPAVDNTSQPVVPPVDPPAGRPVRPPAADGTATVRTETEISADRSEKAKIHLRPLLVLAAAAGIGAGGANALGSFLISGAVSAHIAEGTAGLLAAGGSVCGLLARVSVSWRADRRPGGNHFHTVAAMMVLGAVGYGLLASEIAWAMVIGTVFAFGAGWGWNGLFNYAVIRTHPRSAAMATGITQAGIFAGAVVIPPIFGLIVDQVSYTAAWLLAGGLVLVAATVMLAGGRQLLAATATEEHVPR